MNALLALFGRWRRARQRRRALALLAVWRNHTCGCTPCARAANGQQMCPQGTAIFDAAWEIGRRGRR